jgi:hypothetical protein
MEIFDSDLALHGADQFPWSDKRHTNIKSMLGDTFLKGDGTQVSIDDLKGKYIGVLFSAVWHWQCRRFQQMLEYTYEKLKGEGAVASLSISSFWKHKTFISISRLFDRLRMTLAHNSCERTQGSSRQCTR